jgi:ribosomal protein L15E
MRTRRPCLLSASRRGVFSGDKGHITVVSVRVNTLVRKIREFALRRPKRAKFDAVGRRQGTIIIRN